MDVHNLLLYRIAVGNSSYRRGGPLEGELNSSIPSPVLADADIASLSVDGCLRQVILIGQRQAKLRRSRRTPHTSSR